MSARPAAVIALAVAFTAAVTAQTQVFPPPPAVGGNYHIVVVADRFVAGRRANFDDAALRLFVYTNGLLTDPTYYAAQSSRFTITTLFQESLPGESSKFNIQLQPGVTRCDISWDDDPLTGTTSLIEQTVIGVPHQRVVIIGDYTGYHFGCSHDNWTYLAIDARLQPNVIKHEFGHVIANLLDEYFDPNDPYSGGTIDGPNCSTVQPPWWTTFPFSGVTNENGCFFHASGNLTLGTKPIVRPSRDCRMRQFDDAFCSVCRYEMDQQLGSIGAPQPPTNLRIASAGLFVQPGAPAAPEGRSVSVLVRVRAQGGPAIVQLATDVPGPAVRSQRRTGDYAYEITDGEESIDTGVLTGNPFETRAYPASQAPHLTSEENVASVTIPIPRSTVQSLMSRRVAITIYRLDPGTGRDDITAEKLRQLRLERKANVIGQVRADDLRSALAAGPRPRGRM